MPKPLAFVTGTEYVLDGVGYRIIATGHDGSLFALNLATRDQTGTTHARLQAAWMDGRLRFALYGANTAKEEGISLATTYTFTDLDFLPESARNLIWAKYQFCLPLLTLPKQGRSRAIIQARIDDVMQIKALERPEPWITTLRNYIWEQKAYGNSDAPAMKRATLSIRTVYRWLKRLEASHGDPRALHASHERKGRKSNLDPKALAAFQVVLKEVYQQQEMPPLQLAYDLLRGRLIKHNASHENDAPIVIPSRSTIYRAVNRLDPEEVDQSRLGRWRSSRLHDPVDGGPLPTRPNERWEEDHAYLDYLAIDPTDKLPIGRPLLTLIRDRYCYYPPGVRLSFEPPCARAVLECLGFGILPKSHLKAQLGLQHDYLAWGVPESLAVDNGFDFISNDVELACTQLGIEVKRMPRRRPWFKGSIEKYIGDQNVDLIHTIPGTTFSNFLQRGDYDPSRYACISLERLWELLIQWIVDVYTQEPRRGLVQGIPARLWTRALADRFTPHLPANRDELLVLLTRTATRTIQSTGIWLDDICYQSDRLAPIRSRLRRKGIDHRHDTSEPVQVKYNPGDLSRIWVMNPLTLRYIEVPSARNFMAYTEHLTQWKHQTVKRYVREELKREVDPIALFEAKQQLHAKIEAEFRQVKKVKARTSAARWFDLQVTAWLQPSATPSADDPSTASPVIAMTPPPLTMRLPSSSNAEPLPLPDIRTLSAAFPECKEEVMLLENVGGESLERLPTTEASTTQAPKKRGRKLKPQTSEETSVAILPPASSSPVRHPIHITYQMPKVKKEEQ